MKKLNILVTVENIKVLKGNSCKMYRTLYKYLSGQIIFNIRQRLQNIKYELKTPFNNKSGPRCEPCGTFNVNSI